MEDSKSMDRRTFLSRSGKAAAAAGALGSGVAAQASAKAPAAGQASTEAPAQASSSGEAPPDFIIDSHVHCDGTEEWVEAMVENYRPQRAMACTLTWPEDMELMIEAMEEYPEVFIGYGRVRPDDPAAVRKIEAFGENGFVGMKFHSPRFNWDDPGYFEMYRMCEQLGLHMLFHTGITARRQIDATPRWGATTRMRPAYLGTLCRQFPEASIQGAHFGNPWYAEAAEVARWNPNLYFDVTGSTLFKFIELDNLDVMSEYLWWANWGGEEENPHTLQGGPSAWEHIVFGTDQDPDGLAPNIERFQQMMDANNVPEAVRSKMWGETMANLLDLDPARLPSSG